MPSELKYGNFLTSSTCLPGYTLSGGNCVVSVNTTTPATAPNTCPVGYTVSGSNCVKSGSATIPLSASYTCPFGGTLVGTTCSQTGTGTTQQGGQNTSDRTLTFLYGPEHQRIKQNVVLSGNGTSSYFAGNIWYLNGEDSLGLGFEKEIRTNGTVENKHYVSAGGVVFSMFTSRTGTLNGLPATTTSYLHNDHLSSVAAITDETGTVTERLAYDPWGKRRFISSNPGATDNLDAIVGQKIDRGYTMHEHLDEMGVIHMNGRIYDPLIARFMSADPTIPSPKNLKSYNRYSNVWNNPMKAWDPTGYHPALAMAGAFGIGFALDVASQRASGKSWGDVFTVDVMTRAGISGMTSLVVGVSTAKQVELAVRGLKAASEAVKASTAIAAFAGYSGSVLSDVSTGSQISQPNAIASAIGSAVGTGIAARVAASEAFTREAMSRVGGIYGHMAEASYGTLGSGGAVTVGASTAQEAV